jgi:hypothetical protein
VAGLNGPWDPNPPPLDNWIYNDNTERKRRSHIITKMNENIKIRDHDKRVGYMSIHGLLFQ